MVKRAKKLLLVPGFALGIGASFGVATAAEQNTGNVYAESAAVPAEPDNSGRNVRDKDDRTLTPIDQSNDPADIKLTQNIRAGITSDDAMSMQAKNVKIITQGGVVTLRGPVKTADEKATIESLAKRAGATRINNQLEIDRDDMSGDKE